MPLAPVLNQGQLRWYSLERLKTACLNGISVIMSAVIGAVNMFRSAEVSTATVVNNAVIGGTGIINSTSTDSVQVIVCEDD